MARVETKTTPKRKPVLESLPFTKTNYQILGVGLVVIVLGYVALAQPPWDSAMALNVAPILLVLGYCILIPLGILFRRKPSTDAKATSPAGTSPS